MLMLVKPVQPAKALPSIYFTELGMVILVKDVQFWNTPALR